MPSMTELLLLLTVLVPLAAAALALLFRRWPHWQAGFAFGSMLISSCASLGLLWEVWQGTPVTVVIGGWQPPFGIILVADLLAALLLAMSQIVICAGFLYALGAKDQSVKYPTFYPVFLTLAAGLSGALVTGDLFNMFVFVELLVISGTVLTANSDNALGAEAAYKYFYISLLASTFLLLAIGSLYISYGTLNLADLAQRIAADPDQPLLPIAIALLLATFMIKGAVFPFHFWQPDFHSAAPTPVSAMLSSVVVKLGVYGFLRMTTLLFVGQAEFIQNILVIAGVLGVFYGGLSALGTHDAKRMLAYSTIAQLGFILLGIGWGTELGITAALVFTFNHSLIKSAMLMLAGAVASRAPVKSTAFSAVRGVGKTSPLAGLLFLLGSMALAGVPPTNGFISKMLIFRSGLAYEQFLPLALVGIGGILTLVYTIRAFMQIWWEPGNRSDNPKKAGDHLLAPAILIGAAVLLGFWADPLLALAQAASLTLNQPMAYIQLVLGG